MYARMFSRSQIPITLRRNGFYTSDPSCSKAGQRYPPDKSLSSGTTLSTGK